MKKAEWNGGLYKVILVIIFSEGNLNIRIKMVNKLCVH